MSLLLLSPVPHSVSHKLRMVVLAVAMAPLSFTAFAQTSSSDKTSATSSAETMSSVVKSYRAMRVSKIIGMDVDGANGKKVGEIKDLIVNVNTADVRYAILEFDPGFLKSEEFFAIPLSALKYVADDKPLLYQEVTRAQLDKTAVGKADWEKALDNSRYISALDKNYGYKPPSGGTRSIRASKLLGKDVDSRADKSIGEIKELVLDMGASSVDYVVLAFDPSWLSPEKIFAFPLTDFITASDKDDLILDVDRSTVQSMKNFDAKHWENLNDLNRDQFINRPTPKR